jgi:hypothetical protein
VVISCARKTSNLAKHPTEIFGSSCLRSAYQRPMFPHVLFQGASASCRIFASNSATCFLLQYSPLLIPLIPPCPLLLKPQARCLLFPLLLAVKAQFRSALLPDTCQAPPIFDSTFGSLVTISKLLSPDGMFWPFSLVNRGPVFFVRPTSHIPFSTRKTCMFGQSA